jgi:hypothetical protein
MWELYRVVLLFVVNIVLHFLDTKRALVGDCDLPWQSLRSAA